MELRVVITAACLIIGCFLIIVASIGIIRFPDFYSRMHPAGKTDTLGQAFIFIGLMVYDGLTMVSLKLLIILVFIFIASPTSTHALANAAFVSGLKPWEKGMARTDEKTTDEEHCDDDEEWEHQE